MLGHRQEERIRADERAKVENELQERAREQNGVTADQRDGVDDLAEDAWIDVPPEPAERVAPPTPVERTVPPAPAQRVDADSDRAASAEPLPSRAEPDTLAVPMTAERDAVVDGHEWSNVEPQPVVQRTIVTEQPIEVVRVRKFSLGQLMSLVTGLAVLAFGVTAMVTTGVRTPWDRPVESVFGWNHTPLLGILETAAGALLVLFSLRPGGRWGVGLVGLALIAGGVMVLNEMTWTIDRLGAERNFGWALIVVGGVAVLSSLLTPRRYQYMTGVPVEALAPASSQAEPTRPVQV